MKPRLELLRLLLSEDGVIFVQIDDNEQAYLRVLMDEVFGRGNFIGSFIWQKKKGGGNDSKFLAIEHEYIFAIAKNKNCLPNWFMDYDLDYLNRYNQEDKKGKYYWDTFKRASGKQYYPIQCPDGTKLEYDNNGHRISWLRSEPRFKKDLEIGDIRIIKIGNNWSVQFKQYLSNGKKPRSLLVDIAVNSDAKDEMLKMFDNPKAFDFPKPETLIKYFLEIMSEPNDFILDSFLGSGTTAAVAHKMNRRYIGIEMGEHAYSHCKVRLDKVIAGEQGGISKTVNWQGGGAYKFYELAPSFITKDEFGNSVIDAFYNDAKLIQAMCKLMNFKYQPSQEQYWKHGVSSGKNYLFVTTQILTCALVAQIASHLGENETLIICSKNFESGADKIANEINGRIAVKKIPQSVLKSCHFGKKEYLLPIKENKALEELSNNKIEEEND
jgi:adenine-specific DNA-methyltransferase